MPKSKKDAPAKTAPAKKSATPQGPKKSGKSNTPSESPKDNRPETRPGGNGQTRQPAPDQNARAATGVKTIKSGKIVDRLTADVNFYMNEKDNTRSSFSASKKQAIHPDLKRAFDNLRIHFAIMMDFIREKTISDIHAYDNAIVEDFYVSGFSIGGKEDNPGVVLTGQKRLSNGKVATMNTPFERFEDNSLTAYKFMPDLKTRLDVCKSELLQYLEGKHAPEAQSEIGFPDDDEVPAPPQLTDKEIKDITGTSPSVISHQHPEPELV